MDAIMNDVKVQRIALLNDAFRKSGFGVVLTCGVQSVHDLQGLLKAVREFNSFDENNDPYGERDFGRINWFGDKVFWKIDYYNRGYTAGEDPLAADCKRVLTVMLANEY